MHPTNITFAEVRRSRIAALSDLDLLITDLRFPKLFTTAAAESGVRILCAECA